MKNLTISLIHAGWLILAILSPFIFDWRIVALGVVVLELQFLIFGGCILTKLQFGTYQTSFIPESLKQMGFRVNMPFAIVLFKYVFPFGILIFAYYYQSLTK